MSFHSWEWTKKANKRTKTRQNRLSRSGDLTWKYLLSQQLEERAFNEGSTGEYTGREKLVLLRNLFYEQL